MHIVLKRVVVAVHIIGTAYVQMRNLYQNRLSGYNVRVSQDVERQRFLRVVQGVEDAPYQVFNLGFRKGFVRLLDFLENSDLLLQRGIAFLREGGSLF